MASDPVPSSPPGVVIIASFWIIVGAWILSLVSSMFTGRSSQDLLGLIFVFLSIGLIALGWGLLAQKRWAYTAAFIISLLILIPFAYLIFNMLMMIPLAFEYGMDFTSILYQLFEVFIFIGNLLMALYLYKKMRLLPKHSDESVPIS